MRVIAWPETTIEPDAAEGKGCGRPTIAVPPAAVILARTAGIAPAKAAALLAHHGSLDALRRVDATTLHTGHGLTQRQVKRLHATLELATSLLVEPRPDRPQITQPRDAIRLLLPEMGLLEQEEMRLLLLDTKNRLIATVALYAGTINGCHVRVAEVFRAAVRRNATALIVAHNHPSGMVVPSPEDVQVTREMVQAGRLLDVEVLDHLILGQDCYTSLHERGLGWA